MGNHTEDRKKVNEIITKLRDLRSEVVKLNLHISRIEDRIRTTGLEMRRIESASILEISRATLEDGRPAYSDEWVKKALVEEHLSKSERFCNLLKRHGLLQRQLQRKIKMSGLTQVKIDELESHERLLLV